MNRNHATIDQAQAVICLWEQGRHDTLDIAIAVGIGESAVTRILYAVREAERASAELWAQVEDMTGEPA